MSSKYHLEIEEVEHQDYEFELYLECDVDLNTYKVMAETNRGIWIWIKLDETNYLIKIMLKCIKILLIIKSSYKFFSTLIKLWISGLLIRATIFAFPID